MLPFYSDLMYQDELQYELAHDLVFSSMFLASLDLLQFLPVGIGLVKLLQTSQPSATNLNCAEKSSLVSSSSQLSSHKCVLSPGTSVSSCVQSVIISLLAFPFLVHRVPPKGQMGSGTTYYLQGNPQTHRLPPMPRRASRLSTNQRSFRTT